MILNLENIFDFLNLFKNQQQYLLNDNQNY